MTSLGNSSKTEVNVDFQNEGQIKELRLSLWRTRSHGQHRLCLSAAGSHDSYRKAGSLRFHTLLWTVGGNLMCLNLLDELVCRYRLCVKPIFTFVFQTVAWKRNFERIKPNSLRNRRKPAVAGVSQHLWFWLADISTSISSWLVLCLGFFTRCISQGTVVTVLGHFICDATTQV